MLWWWLACTGPQSEPEPEPAEAPAQTEDTAYPDDIEWQAEDHPLDPIEKTGESTSCSSVNPMKDHEEGLRLVEGFDLPWLSGVTKDPDVLTKRAANLEALKTRLKDSGDEERWLLFIHGTGLQTWPGFQGLSGDPQLYAHLRDTYDGRLMAMEHLGTNGLVCHNIRAFAENLAEASGGDKHLDVDIVAMSKGGLIARALMFQDGGASICGEDYLAKHGLSLQVERAVLLVGPHEGTPSARNNQYLYARKAKCITSMKVAEDAIPKGPVPDEAPKACTGDPKAGRGGLEQGGDAKLTTRCSKRLFRAFDSAGSPPVTEVYTVAMEWSDPWPESLSNYGNPFPGAHDLIVPTSQAASIGGEPQPVETLKLKGSHVDVTAHVQVHAALRRWLTKPLSPPPEP